MHPFSYDRIRAMTRAYRALAAGDVDGFAKPLAPGIVQSVLSEVRRSIDGDLVHLTVVATSFSDHRDQLVVTGHYEATTRQTRRRVTAEFRHEWQFMYGVAWRFIQQVDEPILDPPASGVTTWPVNAKRGR